MGTETYSLHLRYQVKPLYIVKLNNPQMGTETLNTLNLLEYCVGYVKLNNPLMGTETSGFFSSFSSFDFSLLN